MLAIRQCRGYPLVASPLGLLPMSAMTALGFRVRPATTGDWPAMFRIGARAFGMPLRDDDRDRSQELVEFDRTLLAEHDSDVVGVASIYSLQMCLPGGMRPVAGVTRVSVSPTHQRRGMLTALMRRQLDDLYEQEAEPVAALWASEAAIYGRFGYGQASTCLDVRVPREASATNNAPTDDTLGVWFAELDQVRPELAALHEEQLPTRPGGFAYDDRWWNRLLHNSGHHSTASTELRCLLAHDGRRSRGYALFSTTQDWSTGIARHETQVRHVTAADPAAYAALWRTLLGMDLVATVVAPNRPVDDPLLQLLSDPRRAEPRLKDNLWVRLVDVGRALAARSYAADVDVVLDVSDEFCPRNAGHWRLTTEGDKASCERTEDPADVALDVADLAAAFLGGPSLVSMAGAGRVRELRPGALVGTSRAFVGDVAPWCPTIF